MMFQPTTTPRGYDGKSQWDRIFRCLRFFRKLQRKHAATSLLLIQAPTTAKYQCILHIPHDDESNHDQKEEEQPLFEQTSPHLSSNECILNVVDGGSSNHQLNEEERPLLEQRSPELSSSNGVRQVEEEEDKRDMIYDLTRDEVSQMVKRKDWKLLKRTGGLAKVASLFNSDLEQGINIGEGHHVSGQLSKPSMQVYFFHFLLGACKNYTLFFLTVAAALTTATDIMGEGLANGWHTGLPVIMAIFLIVIRTSVKNFIRAKKLEKELRKKRNFPVLVRRGGTDHLVARSEVVEGDVVKMNKDDMIPGDGLLIDENNLVLDEILNPGINSHLNPFLFFGSKVVSGSGSMLIITTRIDTDDTNNHHLNNKPSLPEDLVNKANNSIERLTLGLSLCILVGIFTHAVLLLLNHHLKKLDVDKPELKGDVSVKQLMNLLNKVMLSRKGAIPVLMCSLVVMVTGLQHGVPLVVSLTLSYWNSKVGAQAQMQTLSACATMGLATVLYVDKQICEDMEVTKAWIGGKELPPPEDDGEEDFHFSSDTVLEALNQGILLTAQVPDILTSPSNALLVDWVNSKWPHLNDNSSFINQRYTIRDFGKLSSNKKGTGTLLRRHDTDILNLHWIGDASSILGMCSHYFDWEGNIHCLDNKQKQKFERIIEVEEGTHGLIMMAFAFLETSNVVVQEVTEDIEGLTLVALLALRYPISDQTKEDIRVLQDSGIKIILASELDEPSALKSIARELGIDEEEDMFETAVMESVKPEENQNLVIIRKLKESGEVVAFYAGLSTASIFALREADLGITEMSKSTQMAKVNSGIILKEGIHHLVGCVKFGRYAMTNSRVFMQLQLISCISWLLVTLSMAVSSGDSPWTPVHQIWVNLVTFTVGAPMMRMPLKAKKLFARKPAKRTTALLQKAVWIEITTQVSCQVLVFLIFIFRGKAIPSFGSDRVRSTVAFSSFTLCQVFNQVKAIFPISMDEHVETAITMVFFLFSAIAVVCQVVVVHFAWSCLSYGAALTVKQWTMSFFLAVLPLILHPPAKFLLHSTLRIGLRLLWVLIYLILGFIVDMDVPED